MKAGWHLKPLIDVCQKVTDGSHYSPATLDGGFPYVTVRDIEGGEIDFSGCKSIGESDFADLKKNGCAPIQGDVLFSKDGTVGKVALVQTDRDFVVLSSLAILRPDQELIAPQYLAYAMQDPSFLAEAVGRKTGVAIRRVVLKNLKSIEIPIPSLEEQRRIVAVLDVAFAAIATATANAERNLANARELFEHASSKLLTEERDGSQVRALGEVCVISSKLVDPRLDEFVDLPHIGAGNMESRTGKLSDVLTARAEGLISGKFLFDPTMVLYSKIRPYLMKACRPDFAGLCSADVYPLAPMEGELDRDFLFQVLLSRDFTVYAEAGSARAGMPKLNRDHLFAYQLELPPIDKQRELAERIDALADSCRHLSRCFEHKLEQLEGLKQSILHRAFSGEFSERAPLAA